MSDKYAVITAHRKARGAARRNVVAPCEGYGVWRSSGPITAPCC